MIRNKDFYRNFIARALFFESEAERFRRAGIEIGADLTVSEQNLLAESLAPFSVASRNAAVEMGRLYSVLFCFENEVRTLIKETLEEKLGVDWQNKLPVQVKKNAENRQKAALQDTWLEGEKSDLLGFVDFGDLAAIITNFWEHFADVIPSQQWLTQRMNELEKARNFIAHNRMLQPSEFQRMFMYVSDWNKQVGL